MKLDRKIYEILEFLLRKVIILQIRNYTKFIINYNNNKKYEKEANTVFYPTNAHRG